MKIFLVTWLVLFIAIAAAMAAFSAVPLTAEITKMILVFASSLSGLCTAMGFALGIASDKGI